MRVAHYIADDLERSKAFIAYIALCRKGKRSRAGACIHVPRSFTVAAASVIDGSSPGQSEIITALSDIKKQAAHHAACVAPQVRLELTTLRLTAECSAIELLRIILFPLS